MSTVSISDLRPMRRLKEQDGFFLIEWMTATAIIDRPVEGLSTAMYLPIFLLGLVIMYPAALNG